MEERETQAREGTGGSAFIRTRWLPVASVSAAVVAVLVLAAPAGGGVVATARLTDEMVTATPQDTFSPSAVTIDPGETVTWTNAGGLHNVAFEDGTFTMPMNPSGANWTVSRQFTTAGTFRYYCVQHGAPGVGMAGTITVTGAAPPPGTPPPAPPGGDPPPGTPPPGTPSPGTPGAGKSSTAVTLRVSDATPAQGDRVRFFGTVRPERDGRLVQLQRRGRGGSYRTVERIKLSDAGSARSKFTKRLRILADAVFRARLPADSAHTAGTSRAKRVDVR